jgi:hypothetical protein
MKLMPVCPRGVERELHHVPFINILLQAAGVFHVAFALQGVEIGGIDIESGHRQARLQGLQGTKC